MPGVETYGMQDMGRRIDFLMQLQDLWSVAFGMLTQGYMSEADRVTAMKLQYALELLNAHLINDYDCRPYAQTINQLPKNAEQIPDDRLENKGKKKYNST
jgi:hypothetical protein